MSSLFGVLCEVLLRVYLVLLVGGRVLLVRGVVRGGGLGQRGRRQRARERGAPAAAAAAAAPVHLAALRQRHVRACTHTKLWTTHH